MAGHRAPSVTGRSVPAASQPSPVSSAILANSANKKRRAAEDAEDEDESVGAREVPTAKKKMQKRARRKLSCQSCQRLKCRCDYDYVSASCHRCRTLRIECSLTGEKLPASRLDPGEDSSASQRRCAQYDDSITEIRGMIGSIMARLDSLAGSVEGPNANRAAGLAHESRRLQDISEPADEDVVSAPANVLRNLGVELAGGYRKLLEHVGPDLIELGLLDEQTADELFFLFFRTCGAGLSAELADPGRRQGLREKSPFLHAVCCLQGIKYSDRAIKGTLLHRQIYEQIKLSLGQVLLGSPLPLDEIQGIWLMSAYASAPAANGIEYIDSWLLSGYCAQQAMLSISFSDIVRNVRAGTSTAADQHALRLWANICIHHLHWAASTGRPPTIPAPYLDQCNILLSVVGATSQDGMLVAEIHLFSALHRKLVEHTPISADGECDEFEAWNQRWAHLFTLPKSSVLKISFHAAHLILTVRSLKDPISREHRRTLLSSHSSATTAPTRPPCPELVMNMTSPPPVTPGAVDNGHQQPRLESSHPNSLQPNDANTAGAGSGSNTKQSTPPTSKRYEALALRSAMLLVEAFVEMSPSRAAEVPDYLYMCIAYSSLIIARYGGSSLASASASASSASFFSAPSSSSSVSGGKNVSSDRRPPELMAALEERCGLYPGVSSASNLVAASLAKRRMDMEITERHHTGPLAGGGRVGNDHDYHHHHQHHTHLNPAGSSAGLQDEPGSSVYVPPLSHTAHFSSPQGEAGRGGGGGKEGERDMNMSITPGTGGQPHFQGGGGGGDGAGDHILPFTVDNIGVGPGHGGDDPAFMVYDSVSSSTSFPSLEDFFGGGFMDFIT